MQKLTKAQSLMVIEYFGQQAAEDAPNTTSFVTWERHLWMTRFQASIALERLIRERDWDVLVNHLIDQQSLDRDPAAYLFDRGDADTEYNRQYARDELRDVVGWSIEEAFRNSGA